MKHVIFSLSLLSTSLLGACDHYSQKLASMDTELGAAPAVYAQNDQALNNVTPAAGNTVMPYDHALAQAYYARAVEENERMDYTAAKYFTGKAFNALHGENPAPGTPAQFGVEAGQQAELMVAREKLVAALQAPKTPANQDALVQAQVNYDGWLDQVAENKTGTALTCRDGFMQALSQLEDPYTEAGRFAVTFTPQGTLSPEGQSAVANIAALINQNKGRPYQLVINAPAAGVESSRQFDVITAALNNQGLEGRSIVKTYATAPAPTAAGVQQASYAMPGALFTEVSVKFAPQSIQGAGVTTGATAPVTPSSAIQSN